MMKIAMIPATFQFRLYMQYVRSIKTPRETLSVNVHIYNHESALQPMTAP